ncbi:MAG: phenylalanine--tRNA ligase subunit alpha [Holosporales bacterium]|nr:phenylalanine--tRNA ligase subunit alpha [Holosporales bacterium]
MPLVELEKNLDYWVRSILGTTSHKDLQKLKSDLIGKLGIVTSAFGILASASSEQKKSYGAVLNRVKEAVEKAISQQEKKLNDYAIVEKLKNESIDVSLPVENCKFGGLHLLTQAMRSIRNYYQARGFTIMDGPEVETDFFNFDALNTPKHHPARQSHDTFYIEGMNDTLLRTQTSSVQIRTLINNGIPIRMISIGKTYRNDQLDATHSPMFHQMECLVVGREPISIGYLKSELKKFLAFFFETNDVVLRFRPSFFPFTEPSIEVDCRCTKNGGKLVITSVGDKWLEICGAGMVHPNVFKNCGINEQVYGFAFAFGIDRLVMLKNGITDIRNLFNLDQRWLKYYGTC